MITLGYFTFILLTIAFLTLIYNCGILIAATLLRVKVEEMTIGFGKRLFGFQFAHVQFNFGLWIIGGSVRLADYSAFPGLDPLPDEFRSTSFGAKMLIHSSGLFALLFVWFALIGADEFVQSIKVALSWSASYFFLISHTVQPLQPFTWQRWIAYLSAGMIIINFIPFQGFAGDRLVQTILNHMLTPTHWLQRLYKHVPTILLLVLFVIMLAHLLLDVFT